MNNYLGDFAEDADIYLVFDTADDTGLSITATIAVADIEVYRQNTGAIGLTQRSSTTGFTLDVDHDAMTGTHMVAIDTSDNTDSGFFTTGYDYFVKLNTITVDSISISKWIGHFSLENRYSAGALRPTTAGRTLDVTATGAAGIDWGNVENKTTANDLSGTDIQLCDTVTTNTDLTAVSTIADAVWDEDIVAAHTTADTAGKKLADAGAASDPWSVAIPASYGAGTAGKILGDNLDAAISGLEDLSAADVNAQVVDVMATDTHTEIGQGAPASTASYKTMIQTIYKWLINKKTATATTISIYDAAGSTVDSKSTISDDGTTYTEGEYESGP